MVDRLDIEAVLIHFGADWVPEGERWRKMRCILPGHDDRHPSAAVNRSTGKYSCMACDFHGDGYDLIREITGGDFHAAKLYADQIPDSRSGQISAGDEPRNGWLPPRKGDNKGGGIRRPPWLHR